jgi:hypothetical protein
MSREEFLEDTRLEARDAIDYTVKLWEAHPEWVLPTLLQAALFNLKDQV